MKNNYFMIILVIIFIASPAILIGQGNTDLTAYYTVFDRAVGLENSELHYGVAYNEKHRTNSKESKFFPAPDFSKGSIVFDNLPYYDLDLKYNVFEDELLMQVDKRFYGNVLQLYKDKINSFDIGQHRFLKITTLNDQLKIEPGFYEVILEKPHFKLLKKHRKLLKKRLSQKLVYYRFPEFDPDFVLHYNNDYHQLKKIGDFKALFPEHAERLKTFVKKELPKSNFEGKLKATLSFLDTLFSESNAKTMGR